MHDCADDVLFTQVFRFPQRERGRWLRVTALLSHSPAGCPRGSGWGLGMLHASYYRQHIAAGCSPTCRVDFVDQQHLLAVFYNCLSAWFTWTWRISYLTAVTKFHVFYNQTLARWLSCNLACLALVELSYASLNYKPSVSQLQLTWLFEKSI